MNKTFTIVSSFFLFIFTLSTLSGFFIFNIHHLPMIPVLESKYLYIHAISGFVAYSAIITSLCMYIICKFTDFDLPTYSIVFLIISLVSLFICIVTGSKWSIIAWGGSWSWNIKNTIQIVQKYWQGNIADTFNSLIINEKWNPKQLFTLILATLLFVTFILHNIIYLMKKFEINKFIIAVPNILLFIIYSLQALIIAQAIFAPELVTGLHSSFGYAYLFKF